MSKDRGWGGGGGGGWSGGDQVLSDTVDVILIQ